MKERFNLFSPFAQALLLFIIGAVAYIVYSMLINVLIGTIYPDMPTADLKVQMDSFPIQYMLVTFLPVQLGFLLTPGIIYLGLSRKSSNLIKNKGNGSIVWAFLLFITVFLLLPLFGQINAEITKLIGAYQSLTFNKNLSDHQLTLLIGNVGSSTFYVAVLIIGLITGVAEELVFRRFLFHHMYKNSGKLMLSLASSAFIFALLHFNYLQILPLFIFGIVLAMMYYASGSIWPGIIAHSLNNIVNLYWLANNDLPQWITHIDLKVTIPSTILLMGLIFYYFKRIKST